MKNKARAKGALRPKSESHRTVRIGDQRFSMVFDEGDFGGFGGVSFEKPRPETCSK